MSVYLNPSASLSFNRPLTSLVKRSLTITNPNSQPVAFKVKTTAPKLYCVRPNAGRVEPGESVEVSVMLQALKEEPPLNAKCKDKFLIQSTLLTPEKENKNSQEIWAAPEGIPEEKIHQQKLKVVYLPPEGQILEEEEEGLTSQSSLPNQSSQLPNQSSQLPNQSSIFPNNSQFDTVRQYPTTNGHTAAPIPEFSQSSSQAPPPRENTATPPAAFSAAREEVHEEPPEERISPISVTVDPPREPTPPVEQPRSLSPAPPNDMLLTKYQDAQAEIERLRTLLAAAAPPQELRKRTRRLSEDSAAPGHDIALEEHSHQEGVPLQVVVIIALGVFITTYLFF